MSIVNSSGSGKVFQIRLFFSKSALTQVIKILKDDSKYKMNIFINDNSKKEVGLV